MDPLVDGAHVEGPLAVDQGESSWLCGEVVGGGRHFAVLAWLHRTGPRLGALSAGPGLLDHESLPAVLRGIVPSWLPLITPVKVETDDRPLLMFVLYDLDDPAARPRWIELPVAHRDFDARSFSARSGGLSLDASGATIRLAARWDDCAIDLEVQPLKPAVSFGDDGPTLRHGAIEIGYLQRSRCALSGTIGGHRVTGEGAHDRHWRFSTPPRAAWSWLHLRLPDAREINCYELRDGAGRGCWLVDAAGAVRRVADFELATTDEGYAFRGADLDLCFVHAVAHPYLPLGAFGSAIDGGIREAPIRIVSGDARIAGWLEVFDSSTCRVR